MKSIARWLIVSLALSGTAWAQEQKSLEEQAREQAGIQPAYANVEPCAAPWWVSQGAWSNLTYANKVGLCDLERQAQANTPPPPAPRVSPMLGLAGILTTIAGTGLVLHWGEDNVNFLGDVFCVSDYGDVAYGGCGSALQTKVGLIMIGSGVLMTWVGLHTKHVSVSPQISKTHKAVSTTIKWGAK